MSRRIALTFVVLIAALLVLAVVPLGASITANERQSFRFDTISAARQVSAAAEEYLADQRPAAEMDAALSAASHHDECAAVYRPDGSVLAATRCGAASDPEARALLPVARDAQDAVTGQDGAWLQVAVPISDKGEYTGAVVFARSQDPQNDGIAAMWTWLALTGLGVLALGIVFAFRLASWVSRPLSALGTAAATLGAGDLDVRAPADRGPEQVRALAATFNRMAERTRSLVRSHQVWVADVSHQLRTPLTALRLRLDVLAAESQDDDTVAELSGAMEEIGRLSRLVDGLLALARAEGDVTRPQPVNVGLVAAERVAAWEPVARERGIELELTTPVGGAANQAAADNTVVRLGSGHLEQVLDNVLANALEAVADAGQVRVRVARLDGRVRLYVVDDGPGMDGTAKQAAFHRFATVPRAEDGEARGNGGGGGNGLGLAIVHRLVSADGGAVRLLDTPGGGLTVELDFPAAA